jgi:hypothetical protein
MEVIVSRSSLDFTMFNPTTMHAAVITESFLVARVNLEIRVYMTF